MLDKIVIPNFVGAFQMLAPWLAGALIFILLIGIATSPRPV